ncbi:hypothetical protein ScPMuIL_005542 [Solemya velum]
MSQSKGRVRPLGALRHNVTNNNVRDDIPNYKNIASDTRMRGIHGNAMSVPPAKEKEDRPKQSLKSANSDSGSSTKSQDLTDRKELQQAKTRERELKQQVESLQKQIEELKSQLSDKEQIISDLQDKINKQESHYKKLYEKEQEDHSETKKKIDELEKLLAGTRMEVSRLKEKNEVMLNHLRKEMEERITEITKQKDKEIAVKDEKLNRLKQQMAEALKGNSWERQQQLEELTKELARIQEEADALRLKLKAFKNSKTKSCQNCEDSTSRLEKAIESIRERDSTIQELKVLTVKFEKQLEQQDLLLKQWAESKGHKVAVFPK